MQGTCKEHEPAPHLTSSFSPHPAPRSPPAPQCRPLMKHRQTSQPSHTITTQCNSVCSVCGPGLSWFGAGLVGSWTVVFGSTAGFFAWLLLGVSWLPFLFLIRILPMSSDGLGICWPGFNCKKRKGRTFCLKITK